MKNHPICQMSAKFVQETQKLHQIFNQKIFVAYDGSGNISDYRLINSTFNSDLNISNYNIKKNSFDMKFLDMFMAMNSNFAVLNPASTFSLQIYIIRTIYGLKSVPYPNKSKDIYFNDNNTYIERNMTNQSWISYHTLERAAHLLSQEFGLISRKIRYQRRRHR